MKGAIASEEDRPSRVPLSPKETERRRPPPYFAIEALPDPPRPAGPPGKARVAPAVRVPRKPDDRDA